MKFYCSDMKFKKFYFPFETMAFMSNFFEKPMEIVGPTVDTSGSLS